MRPAVIIARTFALQDEGIKERIIRPERTSRNSFREYAEDGSAGKTGDYRQPWKTDLQNCWRQEWHRWLEWVGIHNLKVNRKLSLIETILEQSIFSEQSHFILTGFDKKKINKLIHKYCTTSTPFPFINKLETHNTQRDFYFLFRIA